MYIIDPASATALSPGSSSTSTNCMSSPKMRKSMSCAVRALPGIGGGGDAAPPFSDDASCGTAMMGVQLLMPAVNTSVLPSAVPLSMFATTSCSLTGPI
jgi:hypothetical protein